MTFINLIETKQQLNKQAKIEVDDVELQGFMDAACGIVEDLKGHVEPVKFTRVHDAERERVRLPNGGYCDRWYLDLTERPVLSVTAVARLDSTGAGPLPVALQPAASGGIVSVPCRGRYTVTYIAGRDEVPATFRLAALELVAHLWRGSQLNAGSGRPPVKGDQMMVIPGMASALPYRVRELLGIYGDVVSDEPVIA